MPAVLSIGHDPMLLKTRASLLRQAGNEVTSVDPGRALTELATNEYALAVLCHSLRPAEAQEIATSVKDACGGCNILLLSRDSIEGTIDGVEVCSAHRPESLLKAVKRLTKN